MEALDGVVGAVVALDPSSGAILGLASTPTYDPNLLSSHDPAGIREYSAQLDATSPDPRSNQATRERYSPGSVFKVVVSAAALADGYTPETVIPAPDVITLPGTNTQLENFGGETCSSSGEQPLIDALTISCNTAFVQLGIDLGEDKLRAMAEAFGMDGDGFEMPLPVVGSTMGEIENDAQLGISSIGQQDVQITAMQGAMIAAAVANDGSLMQPYLVDSVRAPDLSVIDQTDPEEMSRPVSSEVAGQLREMMVSVVENGTGRRAAIDGVTVGGKTGTAEVGEGVNPHTWFIGFAGEGDRQIAVAVFVRNGGESGTEGTGGDISAPIARQVMEAYLGEQGG